MTARIALAGLLLLAACSSGGKDAPDGAEPVAASEAEGGADPASTTAEEAAVAAITGSGGSWPADAPAYAAPYPGARVEGGFSGSSEGKVGAVTTFTTADPPEKVIAFYKERAAAAGLKDAVNMDAGGTRMFGASHTETGRSVNIQASAQEGVTTAILTYGMQN